MNKALEDRVKERIACELGCKLLEASDLRRKGAAFAKTLIAVGYKFSTQHLITTKAVSKAVSEITNRGIFDRIAKARALARLNGGVKAMWLAVFAAQRAQEELAYVILLHDIGKADETTTAIFQALHDAGEISNAQAVEEGYEAYDKLAWRGPSFHDYLSAIGITQPYRDRVGSLHWHE